ncbi:MAG: glycosyltransferase family 2 protein [Spirochaetaceae bacterium]|jgi:hypothetical protein|nr:glycosyltransferase family 2 protein [Spirochaetaceae bacterium]
MTLTIGIPTYNRKDLLQIMAESLYESALSAAYNIRVYDDKSTEYGMEELKKIFPDAVSININKTNLKADKNMYKMYYDFIHNTNDEYFFNADSDIIFKKDWLVKSMELIKKTKGVLSLFNTSCHAVYKEFDDELVLKKILGAAGVLFTRERLKELLKYFCSMEMIKAFDWQWSEYFNGNNIPVFCVKHSLIQHIGYTGQNTGYVFDFGKNYKIETIKHGQIINDIFEKYIDNIRELELKRHKINLENDKKNMEKEALENSIGYHIKCCFILTIKLLITKKIYNALKSMLKRTRNGVKKPRKKSNLKTLFQ